jgi:signal transduction histidine kinase
MQQLEQIAQTTEPSQVSKVIGIPSAINESNEVKEVVHDARNMIAALDLYCDLIQEPGVLATPYVHYSGELRLVAAASRRLVDKLECLQPAETPQIEVNQGVVDSAIWPVLAQQSKAQHWQDIPEELITNLAEEVLANRSLLSSLAGPTIALTVDAEGGAMPVSMTSEDLTRILINLVKNSTQAMSAVGRIHISIWEGCGEGNSRQVILNVEDNGPGLSDAVLEKLFQPQSARPTPAKPTVRGEWPRMHRGLGLSITRSIVEAAGGAIHGANRDPVGACVQIELPFRAS